MIAKLQYITQDHPTKSHIDLCREACEAGCKWIQLRMKDISFDEYLINAAKCRIITSSYNAQLIINDNINVAILSQADGVHLGQNDTNTKEARAILGDDFIIGGTANTYEQIKEHIKNGVNYVGMGPYRFTQTKKNLSPVLGIDGYKKITKQLNQDKYNIPLIAIGGIETKDISPIAEAGIYGIAVSGLITNSTNKKELINVILNEIKPFENLSGKIHEESDVIDSSLRTE